jgi:hypothetical protein
MKLSAISPKSSKRKMSKRNNTQRDTPFNMHSLSPVFSDPFREIDKGIPNCKLQPILLKARMSPQYCENGRVSIKLPEITRKGKFKLNLHFLPEIKNSRVKSPRLLMASSNDARFGDLVRYKSEGFLNDRKSASLESFPNHTNSEALEVSFGRCVNESNQVIFFTN